jgi:YlmC/YmxH family sporulation protein
MFCTLSDLRGKEVIDTAEGVKLGFADDIELDTATGELSSMVIYGTARFLGIFGREDDIHIPFTDIELIGRDVILVKKRPE